MYLTQSILMNYSNLTKLLSFLVFQFIVLSSATSQCGGLHIAGVIDGPLTGGIPKGVQVCANAPIADLSIYGIGAANNGGGTDGQEFTFPAISLAVGECFFVASEATAFESVSYTHLTLPTICSV